MTAAIMVVIAIGVVRTLLRPCCACSV
jgi:hypothetical protein